MKIVLRAKEHPDGLFNDLRELDLDELILMPTDEYQKIRF